ncbi:hypothetical protein F2Q69_00016271 [Brassica cretica]|uniref:Uncharacterized protein n=2 Tax=Brassica cretica TaxID=69181 RepID=A0ABQ7B3L5_BRACR|nr:hypothetical protein DY000_02059624 [Brassica cretica]KAF3560284.1 hypothetical protein F2Q69_00016271 [Brassica cretica]
MCLDPPLLTGVRTAELVNPMVCAIQIIYLWDMLNQTQEAVNSLNSSRTMLGIHTYSISSSVNSVSRQTISPSPLHGSLTLMSESHDLLLHHMVGATTLMVICMEKIVLLASSILVTPQRAVSPKKMEMSQKTSLMPEETNTRHRECW